MVRVNSVNQWKHTLKVYAAEKEMIYLNGTSKVSVSRKRVSKFEVTKHPCQSPTLVKLQGKSLKPATLLI